MSLFTGRGGGIEENIAGMLPNLFITPEKQISAGEVYLPEQIKQDLDRIIHYIKHIEAFGTELGYKGVFFKGIPGTGKSLTAQLLAEEAGADLLIPSAYITHSDIVQQIFEAARQKYAETRRVQILLLDEFERIAHKETIKDPNKVAAIKTLEAEMDGVKVNEGIVVLAISNNPGQIDLAAQRKRRLTKQVHFYPPGLYGREKILEIMVTKLHKSKVDGKDLRKGHSFEVKEPAVLKEIAKQTHGYTGDDIYGLVTEAAVIASMNERTDIKLEDFIEAKNNIIPTGLSNLPYIVPTKKFSELGGLDEYRDLILRLCDSEEIRNKKAGITLIFYGDSGTGKTASSEAVAEYLGYNLIKIDPSIIDPYLGVTGQFFAEVLAAAKMYAPIVVLLDEANYFLKTKEYHGFKDLWTGVVNSILSEPLHGVITIATLNNPGILDNAVRSHADLELEFKKPNYTQREQIWQIKLSGYDNIDLSLLAKESDGFTGRDIGNICRLFRLAKQQYTTQNLLRTVEYQKSTIQDQAETDIIGLLEIFR